MPIFLRIGRHPIVPEQESYINNTFGDDAEIIQEDIGFGDDPVAAVKALIERVEAGGGTVVAIELNAPFPALMKLVDARREFGVPLLRKEIKREESTDGMLRGIVVGKDDKGRDILAFSHYEEYIRVEFQTRRFPPE